MARDLLSKLNPKQNCTYDEDQFESEHDTENSEDIEMGDDALKQISHNEIT